MTSTITGAGSDELIDVSSVPVETTAQIAERLENSPVLLECRDLDVTYVTEAGEVPACKNIDLVLHRGEILGIAGESASGKSTLLNALSRLQRPPATTSGGQVLFHPEGGSTLDLTTMTDDELRRYRWDSLSIVMQSAMASLNPVMRLEDQFLDTIQAHDKRATRESARRHAGDLLEMVGIPRSRLRSYSYQLSGGMQQRALIALSLACDPEIVFMDEPTTAVDVVMQRQILSQILQLQAQLGFAIVFVTHDLSLLLEISDRIAIMYAGRVVEVGMAEQLFRRAQHPYTRGLRASFPPLSEPVRRLNGIPGSPPDLLDLPTGCSFAPRCPEKIPLCSEVRPQLRPVAGGLAACHLATDGDGDAVSELPRTDSADSQPPAAVTRPIESVGDHA